VSPPLTAERTPLYQEHLKLLARMTTFSGWTMPLQYSSIRQEHLAVRNAAGIFDLSHMGELEVTGAGAKELVQLLVSRDVETLAEGRAQYAVLCNELGGIIDDLLVYAQRDGYLLVVNAGNQERDFDWVKTHADGVGRRVRVENVGRRTALLGVQGPRAVDIVEQVADTQLSDIPYYGFRDGKLAGLTCRFSRTGYTGEDGFEIFCASDDVVRMWEILLQAGARDGLQPAGLGARDTLRLEAGMRLYGLDMDEQTNPLEARIGWMVSQGKDFIGRDAILKAREGGLSRLLVGIKMLDRSIPRHSYPVLQGGRRVGVVASGNVSFTLGYSIGTAYVPPQLKDEGTNLEIEIRGAPAPAQVVSMPFYSRPHPD
jgi:aminomethyltransferase